MAVPTIAKGSAAKPGSGAGAGLRRAPPQHGGLPRPHGRPEPRTITTCTLRTPRSRPRVAAAGWPGIAQPPVPLLAFVHSQTPSKTKANSPAAEGAIFTAGLNEEVFFDPLKILNII